MSEKPKGKINEIVYEYTSYYGGQYRLFPTLLSLDELLNDLIKAKTTTRYLRINPFYQNAKVNQQIEFTDFMFYLECRESFTEEEQKNHILENIEYNESIISDIKLEIGKVLYPLCRFDDYQKFGDSLKTYREHLNGTLPEMFDAAKKEMNLKEEDYAFGYFCFEIDSE